MWTDADNKCGQHRDLLHAKSNGAWYCINGEWCCIIQYHTGHLQSGERVCCFEAIKLALLSV